MGKENKASIKEIHFDSNPPYCLASSTNNKTIYIGKDSIRGSLQDLSCGMLITYESYSQNNKLSKYPIAKGVVKIQEGINDSIETISPATIDPIKYYSPGISQALEDYGNRHLKINDEEERVLDALSEVLYITYINQIDIGHNNVFPYCLIGATNVLKRFIRGQYEFLLVFSYFKAEDWQNATLKVARQIRRQKEIAERRPLSNFYMLVSNAKTLKQEIDRFKGSTDAVVIPFSFEELMASNTRSKLSNLLIERFSEYYFENNMLGETSTIEDEALLFGDRGKIADHIVQRCIEQKCSGIFGLRRSGKSSVLKAVLRRLEMANIKYIEIQSRELQLYDSWQFALFDIAKKIQEVMLGTKRDANIPRPFYEKTLQLNNTFEDYKQKPSYFIEDVQAYIGGELFVIAIDEIESITYNTSASPMWQSLESYNGFWSCIRDCGCPLIISGVNATINEQSTITFNAKTIDNPMFERIHNCSGFTKTYLPSFTDEQTKIMINTLGSYSNIAFDYVYADINRAFGGQPYAIRQFCAFLYEQVKHLRGEEVFQVTLPVYEKYIHEFNNSSKGVELYKMMLEHVEIYKAEYEKLKQIAHSPEKYREIGKEQLLLIDHLEKYGLIEYDATTSLITFVIHSLQEYICDSTEKQPNDMNFNERRTYVQDKVAECERKLKTYVKTVLNFDRAAQNNFRGKYVLGSNPLIPIKKGVAINPQNCDWKDIFNHKLFVFYFHSLKTIISDDWPRLGSIFSSAGINKGTFQTYMDYLNAGRTDADHYDAEDFICPDRWVIDDNVFESFRLAYKKIMDVLVSYE